jgi:hypothetical protein
MQELLRSTDITLIAYAQAILKDAEIAFFELDTNTSVLEGSLGILPRRLMVREDDHTSAQRLMIAHKIELR